MPPLLVCPLKVLGRVHDPSCETALVPMRKLSRSNSQTIQPISDLLLLHSSKPAEFPPEYARVCDFAGAVVDCNPGLLRTPSFLAETRIPRRRGSQVVI